MSPIDFFSDLLNPDLSFLPKALAVAVMSSIVCGVVGSFVVLRGMAFIGDAVAHAVFPGLAVAFVVSGNLVLGGTIAGVLTAILVAVFSQNRRLKEDSIIGVFFVAAFAFGIVVISQAPGYAGSLQQFLFGSITGIPDSDLYIVGGTAALVLLAVVALNKEFVAVSLDREFARALGLPVFRLDLILYVLVTLAVVISVRTIGNILVLALLVTPAATARLLTDRLGVMMLLAPIIGGFSAIVGLYISWSWDLPTGGTIVLVLTAVFLAAWLGSPRQGLLARIIARRRARRATGPSAEDDPRARRRGVWATLTVALSLLGTAALATAALTATTRTVPNGMDYPAPSGAPGAVATAGPSGAPGAVATAGPSGAPGAAASAALATPIAELADQSWTARIAASGGIPERALYAYAGAAIEAAQIHPFCGLGWNTLAAIGLVETEHGSMNGATLRSDGTVTPAITGIPLDGNSTTPTPDTDRGAIDGDATWDRAVGPMQFIPSTWDKTAQDGNRDGKKDINQIDDAALAAALHLCEVGGDLTKPENWIAAIAAYNPSVEYNNAVAEAANRYATLR